MSIATQLQALENNISDAYDMVSQRGGTVPQRKNMENLDDAIATIPSGGSFIGIPREVNSQGVYQAPSSSFAFSFPSNATDIGPYVFAYALIYCTSLTSVDLSSLVTISGERAFNRAFFDCTSLTSVDLSSLTTVSAQYVFDYAFYGCTSLASVDLSSLTTVSGQYAFEYVFSNTAITSVVFSSLATVTGMSAFYRAFYGCSSLTSISFPALSNLGSYKNQFNSMLQNCTGVTVHFPATLQSTMSSWTSVQNGFDGTNTTVLFDL